MVMGRILADVEAVTLLRSLLIALVVVSPFAYRTWRRVRRARAEREAARASLAPEIEERRAPRLEDVIRAIDELARDPVDGSGTGRRTVLVPTGVTVDGREPPEGLVDLLVRDALHRSGLVATAELDTAEGRVIECAPAPGGGPG